MEGKWTEANIPWEDLDISQDDIYLAMGRDYQPDSSMKASIDALMDIFKDICHPSLGYTFHGAEYTTKNRIIAGGTELRTGGIITPYLLGAEKFAVFVATAGHEFQEYQEAVKNSGDIFQEFLVHCVGTGIAEAVARAACGRIEKEAAAEGYGISYPYSPGYCGWHVSQQQFLFSLLPPDPCGIKLNESSLMYPIKSVSGVIAVGKGVTKQKYGCELCRKADCYKNRNKEL